MPVNAKHSEYGRMIDRWTRCRDVTTGEDAVHAAGEKYLPKLKDQDPLQYSAYVMRTPFYNATWRTVAGLVGMLLRQPPKVDVPPAVKPLLDDVTMSGVPLQLFVQEVCEEALKCGRLGILVDYPQVSVVGMTQADARSLNLRPMLQSYRAESIINWRTARVNNVMVLTLLVLQEEAAVQVDEFEQKTEVRYRVLDLAGGKYRVRVFRRLTDKDEQIGGDVYPLMGGAPLDYIPFTFIGIDDVTPEVDDPPLIDLVNVNLSHYRSTADLEHGAHFTGLPTPWIAGYKPEKDGEKLYIGSTAAWIFPSKDAKAEYLEFKGEGLKTLQEVIEKKEQHMAILGARMLEPQKRGVEAADTVAIHRKGEESMLAAAAQAISLGVERALEWFAYWAGAAEGAEVTFELNRDFYPAPMTPQMLAALVAGWQAGAYSDQTLFENLQQGEIISQDATLEEEQARIASSGPRLQGGQVDAQGNPVAPPPLAKPGLRSVPTKRTITNLTTGAKYQVEG